MAGRSHDPTGSEYRQEISAPNSDGLSSCDLQIASLTGWYQIHRTPVAIA
jgi:hypothetical protein